MSLHPLSNYVRWIRFVARNAWIAFLAIALSLVASAAVAAQEYVPGEILLGWQPEIAACSHAGPAQEDIGFDTCGLLADLAPAGLGPDGWLAEQHDLPEWQAAARSLATLTGLEVRDLLLPYGVARLGVAPGSEAVEIERLSKLHWVSYAEPNHIARAADLLTQVRYPNDPYIGEQWNMRRIAAPQAWTVTRGTGALVVAVLDSGVDLGHPEFIGRLASEGRNYVNPGLPPNDDYGHGTHVAGLIAANADNFTGISGLAPDVRLLPLKVLNSQGVGTYYNIAEAIRYAVDLYPQIFYVRIINLSLGGYTHDETLQGAVNDAISRGRLVVAASGNCGQGGAPCPTVNPNYYPAAYSGVLAVGASERFDSWASYSGYKPYVGLASPGGTSADQIWSTWRNGGYNYLAGTSMAAPLVSAAAALVWSVQPAASAQQVAAVLQSTADKVGAFPYINGRNDYFGYGRLNVSGAVRWAYPPALTAAGDVQRFLTDDPSRSSARVVSLLNPSEQPVQWQAQVTQGAGWLTLDLSAGQVTYSSPGILILRAGPAAPSPGVYAGTVRVTAVSPSQLPPLEIQVELRVAAQLHRSHLPAVMRDWHGMGWLDPFAPGMPAPQDLNLLNDSAYPVALPFPVTFFGQAYWGAWVSDNGLVWFGQGASAALQAPTACLPSAAAPNNAIYVLALDWNPALGGRVYAHRPDADTYVITWHEVQRPWVALPQSFQLIFRRSGEIIASYRAIEALPPAIIGAENDDGTVAEQVYCNGTGRVPSNGDAFRLTAILPWQ